MAAGRFDNEDMLFYPVHVAAALVVGGFAQITIGADWSTLVISNPVNVSIATILVISTIAIAFITNDTRPYRRTKKGISGESGRKDQFVFSATVALLGITMFAPALIENLSGLTGTGVRFALVVGTTASYGLISFIA